MSQSQIPVPAPTVLLIEDNAVNRYTVARMLRQAGFEVAEAENGAQAMQQLGEVSVDAIVCDVDLPDVNGFELCRQLKADPRFASIPFLQMSAAFTSAQHQVQGLEGGADGYLVQPFEVPVLAATIRAFLRLRAAEEQGRSLTRQWSATFAAIRDAIVVTDAQGTIVRCNSAFGALFGQSPEGLQGKPVSALGDYLDFSPQVLSGDAAETESEVQIGKRWFRVRRDSIWDENGAVTGLIQVLSDSTNNKRAAREREELIRSLEFERGRLAAIFQNSPSFVNILRGPQHVFELVNPAYYQIIGQRDVIGKTPLEALPEIDGQGLMEALDKVLLTGVPFEGRELSVSLQRDSDAPLEVRFVNLLIQPLLEADGTTSGVLVHGVDITEQVRARKEAETARAQAEDANRLKDEFLATLSHELRTPLTSILGWAHLLRTSNLDAATSAQALESIERNTRAQAQLVEDILDVSRIMSGKLGLIIRQLDLGDSIDGAINSVRPAASAKGIRLVIDLDPNAGLIAGDANRLQQIIWNLLSNAIKFTPRGGRVEVSLDRDDSCAQITVSDSGQGIAAEFLPHVFDRFRQADSSSTRTHSGLGLGLAIVRHLVELHGGSIGVWSDGEGLGAIFRVRFPLAAVVNGSEKRPESTASNGLSSKESELGAGLTASAGVARKQEQPLDGVRVLVVDDEPDARQLIGAVLQHSGAQISLCASVAQAWGILQETARPDVLVSDIGMPEEDGYSLIQRLRQDEAASGARALPALALTAFARAEDRTRTLQAGFDSYVSKPVEPLDLVAAVSKLVRRV